MANIDSNDGVYRRPENPDELTELLVLSVNAAPNSGGNVQDQASVSACIYFCWALQRWGLETGVPLHRTVPAATLADIMGVTCLQSVAGLTIAPTGLVTSRPCGAPHRSITDVGLVGVG
jgi:hypothetical protein